ncbi:MAG: hypothetical protein H0U76_02035 [Ktedonobacteraceae bacterium]|nr:hypothetical protein [Ktedonobacteraceae bacterium]
MDLHPHMNAIRQAIFQSQTVDAVLETLRMYQLLQDGRLFGQDRESCDLVYEACRAVRTLTMDASEQAEQFILTYFLPWLDQAGSLPEDVQIEIHYCRELLCEWIYQHPENIQARLLERISLYLIENLMLQEQHGDRLVLHEMGFTIASIGYRHDRFLPLLWDLANTISGEVSDQLLATMGSLSPQEPWRSLLLTELHRRATSRLNRWISSALSQFSDPSSVDVITEHWLKPDYLNDHWLRMLSEDTLTHLANAADDVMLDQAGDNFIASKVWEVLKVLTVRASTEWLNELSLRSNLIPHCNTGAVIPEGLGFLDATDATEDGQNIRWRMYMRLNECLRPAQLQGWEKIEASSKGFANLWQDAAIDTGYTGRGQTALSLLKEQAWNCLMRTGSPPDIALFTQGVEHETNLFVRGELYTLLATIHLAYLPSSVAELIREEHDVHDDHDGEPMMRMRAITLAQSIATHEAFDALRLCGLHSNGFILLDTGQSLARISEELVREGDTSVIPTLLEQLEASVSDRWHTLAAVALEHLARADLLASFAEESMATIARILPDRQRSEYQLAHLVMSITHLASTPISAPLLATLWELAGTDPGILGWTAMETLVYRHEALANPATLKDRLGLSVTKGIWHLRKPVPSQPPLLRSRENEQRIRLIAELYRQYPTLFQPAIIDLLKREHLGASHWLLWAIEEVYQKQSRKVLPKQLQNTILTCATSISTYTSRVFAVLKSVGQLLPDAFCQISWGEIAQKQEPQVMMHVASVLGMLELQGQEGQQARDLALITFMSDNAYGVRRAAYRELGQRSSGLFWELSSAWSTAASRQLRLRAAEAIAWFPAESIWQERAVALYRAISTDRDRTVRERAQQCWKERREWIWAESYLKQIMSIETWNDEDVRRLWSYGAALAQLGGDTQIQTLWGYLNTHLLPSYVRIWLGQIAETMEKQWQDRSSKWPTDIPSYTPVAAIQATLSLTDQGAIKVHLFRWLQPDGVIFWEGFAIPLSPIEVTRPTSAVASIDGESFRCSVQSHADLPNLLLIYGMPPAQNELSQNTVYSD